VKKLGLIVNPLAGIGGRVALKGSDGADTVRKAFALGATPVSPKRASEALKRLCCAKDAFELVTYPGEMGEDVSVELGFSPTVVGSIEKGRTTANETKQAARHMLGMGVALILFAGGDGTARDIYDAVGGDVLVIGIPSGVKIHSGVFASSPMAAGELAMLYLAGKATRVAELEVMDIDEDAFRNGVVKGKLYGYLKVPDESRFIQGAKAGGHVGSDEFYVRAIAERIVQDMRPDCVYVVGSGTTTRAIMEKLGLPNSLLGIDVVENGTLKASDVTEKQLLEILKGREAEIIVTPIGGQGYIFGRGNQQLSPEVIRMVGVENIKIIATPGKILSLPAQLLRVDTGDAELDELLRGPRRVITAFSETAILEVV